LNRVFLNIRKQCSALDYSSALIPILICSGEPPTFWAIKAQAASTENMVWLVATMPARMAKSNSTRAKAEQSAEGVLSISSPAPRTPALPIIRRNAHEGDSGIRSIQSGFNRKKTHVDFAKRIPIRKRDERAVLPIARIWRLYCRRHYAAARTPTGEAQAKTTTPPNGRIRTIGRQPHLCPEPVMDPPRDMPPNPLRLATS